MYTDNYLDKEVGNFLLLFLFSLSLSFLPAGVIASFLVVVFLRR
jgi:hypothetical protein